MQYAKKDFSLGQAFVQPEPARRRSIRRSPQDMTAEIEIDDPVKTCQCQVVDLSVNGIGCLEFGKSANFKPDATLIVWLTHGEDTFLPVIGRLVHRHDHGSFRHLGIELEPEGAEMIGIGSLV